MFNNKQFLRSERRLHANRPVITAVLCAFISIPTAYADGRAHEAHWVGVQAGLSQPKAKGSDFDQAANYGVSAGYWLTDSLAVEAGATALRDAKEDGADNRGSYVLTAESDEAYVGPRLVIGRRSNWLFFVGGGLLHSQLNLENKEEFYGLKVGGTKSTSNSATGYYAIGGVTLAPSGGLSFSAFARYRHRPDIISTYQGDLDLDDTGGVVSLDWRF